MSYNRICPRDLFNESKLLKGLGALTLLIGDGRIPGLNFNQPHPGDSFEIIQNDDDGSICVANLDFFDDCGTPVHFYNPLNSKYNWPLVMEYKGLTYYVFNEEGAYQLDRKLFLNKGMRSC